MTRPGWLKSLCEWIIYRLSLSLSTACPERSNFCVPSINRGCLLSLFLSVNFTKAKKYFVLKIRNTKLVQNPSNLNYVHPMIWLKSLPFNDPLISFKIKWLVMTFLRPRIALLLVLLLKYVYVIWQTLKNYWNNFFSEQQLALRIGNFMIHVFLWQGCYMLLFFTQHTWAPVDFVPIILIFSQGSEGQNALWSHLNIAAFKMAQMDQQSEI